MPDEIPGNATVMRYAIGVMVVIAALRLGREFWRLVGHARKERVKKAWLGTAYL
ncbi:MAG: CCDC90 family protein [Syntrophorhabdaceae bacterium]|nr:CCDC90 family protein [Syntrophorhabdaceae bacterium]